MASWFISKWDALEVKGCFRDIKPYSGKNSGPLFIWALFFLSLGITFGLTDGIAQSQEIKATVDLNRTLFPIRINGRQCFADKSGNIRIRVNYRGAFDFKEGRACIVEMSSGQQRFGVIDDTGRVIVQPQYGNIISYSEGFAGVLDPLSMKHGYIDKAGKEVIPCKYALAGNFSEGLAFVQVDYGSARYFIDYTGRTVLQPKHGGTALGFQEGMSVVIFPQGKYGFMDKSGEMVIPASFSQAGPFSDGLAMVRDGKSGKFGFINKSGKYLVQPIYDNAGDFSDGMAIVGIKVGEKLKYGYIDKTGKLVIQASFPDGGAFSEGLAVIRDDSQKSGYIDKTGRIVIPPQFDMANEFIGGLARVYINSKSAYIDQSGNVVLADR